ncbi:MAG: putative hydrolase or acyltransferases (alpha/beta hydrolase superfamily) [Halonotius sp. J07HN6]|nr:MAG: putative hydrolase or acyltransferases (alpha/beta hydrolase superfamily) [Halonotius sp. J07HN6]
MSSVDHDGCSIHYTTAGPSDAPAVVFLGDLGFGAWQWSWQYDAVAGPFRAVVVDTRGCGRSDAPAGSWEIGEFVADLDAVLADQNLRKAHLVGCGLGGCVALAAAHRTNRARSLTLIGTPATGGEFDPTDLRADSPTTIRSGRRRPHCCRTSSSPATTPRFSRSSSGDTRRTPRNAFSRHRRQQSPTSIPNRSTR